MATGNRTHDDRHWDTHDTKDWDGHHPMCRNTRDVTVRMLVTSGEREHMVTAYSGAKTYNSARVTSVGRAWP
eukprot:364320-Chlamydomonas_euryale.AAC.6